MAQTILTLDQALALIPVKLSPFCAVELADEPADGENVEFEVDDSEYSDYVTLKELPSTLELYDEAEVTYILRVFLPNS